jgi:hypothetical protein
MACCAIGAAITLAIVWTVRFVRTRVRKQAQGTEAAAWRLHAWRSSTPSKTRVERTGA